MAEQQPRPILITGAGRRIGLALAHHFLQQRQPVIVSYRTPYPAIDGLREAGALCLQADFSSDDGILTFAEAVKSHTNGLRAIIHNASDWMAEKPGVPLSAVINRMMQIHVHAPYLLNHALEALLRGHGHAASDIIHITDYVVERGSDKHIAYAASKAALDNMTRSFARKLAPEVKVNAIAPSLILSFDLHIEPISKFKLSESSMQHLRAGDIVALDDQYTFIQRIPRSHYVLSVGPVPYLYFLHEMRLLDVALMAFIAISLAFPVFIWMRPHWQDMLRIETAAQRFGEGHLSERIHFDSMSSFERLGVAFNQMADNINALIASKKQLIDGIAHELRTPLVRLRYRLEMSENLTEAESQALNRDIGQLEALIEELLTYARLDRPQTELSLTTPDFPAWISDHVEDIQMVNPQREVALATLTHGNYGALDMRLMERVLDNLVNNALRYSSQRVAVSLTLQGSRASLLVEDDGPGIAPEERERVFEPFVRLDPSRDRATGGCGLGLAIVHSIAQAMGGEVRCEASPLGGARFCFSWPVYHQLPDFTSA